MSQRTRVERLFDELDVERVVDVQQITDRVSAVLGLDISVDVLGEAEWATLPRFELVTGDHARIPIRESDPRWYRLHVITHTLAHLLCGHSQCAQAPMTFAGAADAAGAAGAGDLVKDLLQKQEAEADVLSHRLSPYVLLAPGLDPARPLVC